jgi:OmpA-OmpF porin, OOP family
MKKSLILLFLIIITFNGYSQKNKDFGRWSFYPEFGFNLFDGDINQDGLSLLPNSFREITYGLTLEYALTPVWGLSFDYFYFPLKAQNSVPLVDIDTKFHNVDFNATVNLMRLIFPESKSKISFNGSIGIGFAQYYTDPIDPSTGLPPKDKSFTTESSTRTFEDSLLVQSFRAGSIPVTFSLEYNLFKQLSIGGRIHYRANTRDNLEGVTKLNFKGVTNDYIAATTIYIRYKFGTKSKSHLRDLTWQEYEPAPGLIEAREAKDQVANLNSKVEAIGNRLNKLETKMNSYEKVIQNFQVFMSNDGPDSDKDGVPDVRDKEPNTPSNAEVDFWGQSIRSGAASSRPTTVRSSSSIILEEVPSVYFDFDRADLDDHALETIRKVALKLQSDSTIFVEVRGYCDYSGRDNYNRKLSNKRAERVKQELVRIWKIDPRRINANGNGRIVNPPIIYRPNRRCDFYFNK